MSRHDWPGWILIISGAILLLYELDYVDFTRADLFSYGFIVLGVLLAIKAFNRPDRSGLFGAVFFLSYGIILTFIRYRYFVRDDEFAVATFFLSFALANFVIFLVRRNRWVNFTWGIITGVVGAAILSIHLGYYPHWYIYDLLEQYWPVALILLGLTILLKSFRRGANTKPAGHPTP